MLTIILIALAAVLATILVVAALKSPDFSYTRSAVIAAPPDRVFGIVNNIRRWNDWSPWTTKHAAATAYTGPESGPGAVWSGKDEMGEGTLTVTAATPGEQVVMRLEYVKPMACDNTVQFTFRQEGEGTRVTWTMTGKHNFIGKASNVVLNMDKLVGASFLKGLSNLGKLATGA